MKRIWILCVSLLALSVLLPGCAQQLTGLRSSSSSTEPLNQATALSADGGKRYIVLFRRGNLPDDAAALIAAAGGTLAGSVPGIGMASAVSSNPDFAATLNASAKVLGVAEDQPVQWIPENIPVEVLEEAVDEGLAPDSHNPAGAVFFGRFQWNMRAIRAHLAWAAGFQGVPAVKVAVLDTGVDFRHLDLIGQVDLTLSRSFVPEDDVVVASLFPGAHPIADLHFHGTHVSGIVAARGIAVAGVAPHVQIIGVKVLNRFGRGTFEAVINGIVYAANVGADVINMSLGARFPRSCVFPDGSKFPSECATLMAALNRATNFAHSRGVMVIAAAGNAATDADRDGNTIIVPAQSSNVIAVSATGPLFQRDFDQLAFYSDFGSSLVNVAAPGGNAAFDAAGRRITPVADLVLSPCSSFSLLIAACRGRITVYLFAAGTSMAAPHVAGVAALYDSIFGGGLNGADLRAQVQDTADDCGSAPNPCDESDDPTFTKLGKPGRDEFYGRGRVDACRAVGVCP